MLFITQLLNMMTKKQIKQFVALFDDLSFEVDEMGWKGQEDEMINDMLINHFGLELVDDWQLSEATKFIMNNQGKLKDKVRGIALMIGKA